MKLIPIAKPIRIRIVSGGEEHSSLESLRNNYSLNDIVKLAYDGSLCKWLKQKGEYSTAEIASLLVGMKLETNSDDIINLTALIFQYPSTETPQLAKLVEIWKTSYPRSYNNYIKDFSDYKDIASALEAYYISDKEDPRKWNAIFVRLLKSVPLAEMMHIYKSKKNEIPLSDGCWLQILNHFSKNANPKELFDLGMMTYNNSYLSSHTKCWITGSANGGYQDAKEFINKKRETPFFDEFIKNPASFKEIHNRQYESDVVNFLCVLSRVYTQKNKVYEIEIEASPKFAIYFDLINAFWHLSRRGSITGCYDQLKLMSKKYQDNKVSAEFFEAIQNNLNIDGKNLRKISFEESIIFVAKRVKSALFYGK